MNTLLDDIKDFIARHEMADSTFGRDAVNDWEFVKALKAGRRVWPETEAKVRDFMERADAKISVHSSETAKLRDSSRKSIAA